MNIELHGFLRYNNTFHFQKKLWEVITNHLSESEYENYVITMVNSASYDHTGEQQPFIRVYSDRTPDFQVAKSIIERAGSPLEGGARISVECVKLTEFFEC